MQHAFLFMNLEKFENGGAKLEELAAPRFRAAAPYSMPERSRAANGFSHG